MYALIMPHSRGITTPAVNDVYGKPSRNAGLAISAWLTN